MKSIFLSLSFFYRSKCKNLPTIREDEEVFGVLEEDAEVSCSGLHHKLASASVAASTKLFLVTDSMIKRLAQQARPTCGMCRENNQVDVVEAGTSAHIVWVIVFHCSIGKAM